MKMRMDGIAVEQAAATATGKQTLRAGCHYCDADATTMAVGGSTASKGDAFSPEVRRTRSLVDTIYTCAAHYQQAMDELLASYGGAGTWLERDALVERAQEVLFPKEGS